MPTALIVDGNADSLLALAEMFRAHGYSAETAQDLDRARDILTKRMPEVAVFDERIGDSSSLDLLEQLDLAQVVEIYLMSNERTIASATRAMRLGVTDYFNKPINHERLADNLTQLNRELTRDLETAAKGGRGLLIGDSLPMQKLYRLIRKIAPSDAFVLLTGERGTGKEIIAETIHQLSYRADAPMVSVNLSAVPGTSLESELFGHRKGSFAGATGDHRGCFERAHRGTLFLDEITEMDPSLQATLLEVLRSRKVRPIGGEQDIGFDVRVVAATSRDPGEAVANGTLGEELYYRLAQFPIRVPPLRERGDDIRLLAEHFLRRQNEETGLDKHFAEEALEALQLHEWPGNVRELQDAVIHGHLLSGREIRVDDLPDGMPSSESLGGDYVRTRIGASLAEVERRHIIATLAHFDGDKKKTADVLGVSLKTLYNRLKRYAAR